MFYEFTCCVVKVLVLLYGLVYLYTFGVFFVSCFCGVFWIHPIPKSRPQYILSESYSIIISHLIWNQISSFQLIPSLRPYTHPTHWSCWNSIQGECHHHSPHLWLMCLHFWPRLRFCPSVNLANLNVELLVPGTSIIQPKSLKSTVRSCLKRSSDLNIETYVKLRKHILQQEESLRLLKGWVMTWNLCRINFHVHFAWQAWDTQIVTPFEV